MMRSPTGRAVRMTPLAGSGEITRDEVRERAVSTSLPGGASGRRDRDFIAAIE